MASRIRIAVVDDHPLLRDGVIYVLKNSKLFDVVGEGRCLADAVQHAQSSKPDIMLLDISMPGGGINAAAQITATCPDVRCIMLTVSEQEEDVAASLQSGARGYILKGTSGPELIRIAQSIHQGESYVTPGLAARLLTQTPQVVTAQPEKDGTSDLTYREEQVLDHVSRGLTNKEIANSLSLSEKTVKHYMTNIMQKLNVRNRVEAVLTARQRLAS
jgi:DNA-binding NarL/FixJ family response regulator